MRAGDSVLLTIIIIKLYVCDVLYTCFVCVHVCQKFSSNAFALTFSTFNFLKFVCVCAHECMGMPENGIRSPGVGCKLPGMNARH